MVSTRRRTQARATASDGNPTCIDMLNDELLLHTFDILNSSSRPAILAATLASSKWHALAQRVIDGDIGPITISTKTEVRNLKLFGRMKRDASFGERIKHLSIGEWFLADMEMHEPDVVPNVGIGESPYRATGYFSQSWSDKARQKDATWHQVSQLMNAVIKLRLLSFSWNATPSLPRGLAHALATNEHCNVRVGQSELAIEYTKLCYAPYANHWSLEGLQKISQNLTSLHVLVPAADDQLLQDLGQLVWSSPSLRELRVNAIGRMWTSDVVPYDLRQTNLGKLSTVTELQWLTKPEALKSPDLLRLSTLELSNVCVCSSAVAERWMESVDWNRLGDLTLTCFTLLRLVYGRQNKLISLRCTVPSDRSCELITCTSRSSPDQVLDVLQGFTSLRHLELINGNGSLTPVLLKHIGRNLRSLAVHDRTQARWESGRTRPLLDGSIIECIGGLCENLSRLAIDVPYSDLPYLEFLNQLAHSVPKITSLAVYREVEVPGTDVADPPRTAVTLSSVQKDFIHLQQQMGKLLQFDMLVTSMPPFYLDKRWHERGNGLALYQRHLRVDLARTDTEDQPHVLHTRSIDVERAAEAVKHSARGPTLSYWQSELPWKEHVAKNAYDFSWKPLQPY